MAGEVRRPAAGAVAPLQAEATRQATHGRSRNYDPLWRLKAREDGRLRTSRADTKISAQAGATRAEAVEAWLHVGRAPAKSGDSADRDLARSIAAFINEMPAEQLRHFPLCRPDS